MNKAIPIQNQTKIIKMRMGLPFIMEATLLTTRLSYLMLQNSLSDPSEHVLTFKATMNLQ